MGILENVRHEAFAQAVAEGETAIGAYRKIYQGNANTAKKAAYRIKARPEVKARITELRQQIHDARFAGIERNRYLANLVRHGSEDSAAHVAGKIKAVELHARLAGELHPKPRERKPTTTALEKALHELVFGEQGEPETSGNKNKT
jgi:hypothetical protein